VASAAAFPAPNAVHVCHSGRGLELHEGGEGLVEPDPVPPLHGHEVTEPHVGRLVGDHLGDAHELHLGGVVGVGEQGRLPVGDAAQVLHGAEGKVGDGDVVDLVARVGDGKVVREVPQGVGGAVETERRQRGAPRGRGEAEGDTVDVDGLGQLERTDDPGQHVRRHPHRLRELHAPPAVAGGPVRHHRAARQDRQVLGDDERHGEGGLEIGLVPARERPPGVGRFKLRGGDDAGRAAGVGEGAAVEAVEVVVEDPGERESHHGRPGRHRRGQLQRGALQGDVDGHGGRQLLAVRRRHGGRVDVELGGIEDHRVERLLELHLDVDGTAEGRRLEIGRELDRVALRDDGAGEAIGSGRAHDAPCGPGFGSGVEV
jgi:hypothetical protein